MSSNSEIVIRQMSAQNFLLELEENSVDLIWTDPSYGTGHVQSHKGKRYIDTWEDALASAAILAKDPVCHATYRLEFLLYVQVLEWQKTQKHVVTTDTPAGADVIYTNKRGEEHPAVLVAHIRNAQAWIWISSDPSNYLLNLIKLEDLRLAEESEG